MPVFALVMILGSALMHATWNLFSKRSGGGLTFVWLMNSVSALLLLPLGLWAFGNSGKHFVVGGILVALASAALHSAYNLLLQRAYRSGDLSLVYPLARGTGPLLSSALAMVFFAERPSLLAWLGIIAIVAGGLAVSMRRDFFRAGFDRRAIYYGVATGGMIAAYTLTDKAGVSSLAVPPALYYLSVILAEELMLAPLALRRGGLAQEWRANRTAILVVGVLSPLSYLLILFAFSFEPVSYVAPVREVSILIAVVLGGHFLREGAGVGRIAGACAMIAGIATITLAR